MDSGASPTVTGLLMAQTSSPRPGLRFEDALPNSLGYGAALTRRR
jgi:hypothetical protein